MARAWRIEYEGALYHVLSRGNQRQAIFTDDEDRFLFLERLSEMADRFEVECYAYVLMNNHYHLLLRTRRANLSKAMQWLGVAYTSRFNFKNHCSGHLFQGRFKSMLVENDAYLLQLSYYIHRNPLRAGIVERLADCPWSSYTAYAYGKERPEWLNTEVILSQMINAPDRNQAYRESMKRYAKEEGRVWEDLKHGIILGSERFVESIKERFLPEVPHREIPQQRLAARASFSDSDLIRAANELGCDIGGFRKSARVSARKVDNRDLLIYLIWQSGGWTNQAIGDRFGLTYSAVSRRVSIFKNKLREDQALLQKFEKIRSSLGKGTAES
jgi:REP element-mobilizing transposase RayT